MCVSVQSSIHFFFSIYDVKIYVIIHRTFLSTCDRGSYVYEQDRHHHAICLEDMCLFKKKSLILYVKHWIGWA